MSKDPGAAASSPARFTGNAGVPAGNTSKAGKDAGAPSVAEHTRMAGDLAAFRRMMQASQGTFSFSLAVCDDRTLRDSLVQRLSEEFPGLLVLRLPPQVGDVYQIARQQYPSEPSAIFLLDLEASIPFAEDAAQPALRVLNSTRESWEKFACPVVLWLAEYAAVRLAKHAPDLWRYRSHQFSFLPDPQPRAQATRESFPGYAMVDALPYEEKAFRVLELERRLAEAGDPPPGDLLSHALDWTYELAWLYRHASRYAEAERCYHQALAWVESRYGPDHPRTATALNNLASLLQAMNRLAEAEPLYRRALAINEKSLSPEHPGVASLLNNLALLLQAMHRPAEAEPLLRRALAIDGQAYGDGHREVALKLNNLALLLQDTNRLAEAEPLYRRALAIDEQSLGPEHPRVSVRLNNLAMLLQDTNRLAEAEPLYRRALAIDERAYGAEHPEVAIRLHNLARLLQATNRLAEAERLMRRAVVILAKFTASTGQGHPRSQRYNDNYHALLIESGLSPEEAEARVRSALAEGGLG